MLIMLVLGNSNNNIIFYQITLGEMFAVLSKLFTGNKNQAFVEIVKKYEKQNFCVVHFLYLATAIMNDLFELDSKKIGDKIEKQEEYKRNVLESDFLLPDGIALQLFYGIIKMFSKIKKTLKDKINNEYKNISWLSNLNGTDFIPYFLESLAHKFGSQKICLALYGSYSDVIEKTEKYFSYKGFNVIYGQDGYAEFDWYGMEEKLVEYSDTINILLVARGTPLQENRVADNMSKIQKNNLIVFTGGGLFDHLTGKQKRVCKLIRVLKLEWFWRLLYLRNRTQTEKVTKTFLGFKQLFRYLLLKKA